MQEKSRKENMKRQGWHSLFFKFQIFPFFQITDSLLVFRQESESHFAHGGVATNDVTKRIM